MKYIIALIASISIWNIGHAQVKGVVLDDEGNPAYALVYYKGTQLGTVTNAEGEFSIGIPKEAKWHGHLNRTLQRFAFY